MRFAKLAVALCSIGLMSTSPALARKSASGIETSHISEDFVAAVIVHPKQFYESRLVKQVIAEWDKIEKKETTAKLFAKIKQELGVDIRHVTQFALLMDRDLVRSLPATMRIAPIGGGGPGGPGGPGAGRRLPTPIFSFVVRFDRAVDQKPILRVAIKTLRGMEMGVSPRRIEKKTSEGKPHDPLDDTTLRKHDGREYRVLESMGLCFVNEKTLLISHETLLKRMISAKDVKSPLLKRLATLPKQQDVVLAADMKPFAPLFDAIKLVAAMGPPEAAKLLEYIGKTKSAAFTAGASGKTLVFGAAEMPGKDDAAGFAKLLNGTFLPQIKALWKIGRAELERQKSPIAKFAAAFFDEVVARITISAKGTDVALRIDRPAQLDKLPELAQPIIKDMRAAARVAERKNNLKQIGLAMHNYHDVWSKMPGHGTSGGGKKGLSWRVHILPYVDEGELYKQFKLDEPWDSKHNKKLIEKMPKIYVTPGVKDKGKTAIHVFIGKGTPFGDKTAGPRIRDIHDGTSNTFMAVEAGPDKADVWTKPGGIPFDAKAPLKALGRIPDSGFLALFFDGRVRFISKTIDLKILNRLIQHSDGQPLGEF